MKVRLATLDDIEKITLNNIHLAQEFREIEKEQVAINFNDAKNGVYEVIKNKSRGFYLLNEINENIAGQIFITTEWSDWRNKEIWWLHRIYIQKEYRTKGIFRLLFKEIVKMAKDKDVFALRLYLHKYNRHAKTIYEKLGLNKSLFEIYNFKIRNNNSLTE